MAKKSNPVMYDGSGTEPDTLGSSYRPLKQLDCNHVKDIASQSEDMIGFTRPRYFGRDRDEEE